MDFHYLVFFKRRLLFKYYLQVYIPINLHFRHEHLVEFYKITYMATALLATAVKLKFSSLEFCRTPFYVY